MSSSSGTNPAVSINIRDGPAGSASAASSSSNRRGGGTNNNNTSSSSGGVVQNLINNSSRPREATPLLTTTSVDYPHHDDGKAGRLRSLKGVTWLVGVAVVVAISLFALLALHRGKADAVPFPHVTHPLQPTPLWGAVRRPYPTGAWWTNLVLGKGDNNVAQLPYAIKASNKEGVQVSYSNFRHMSTSMTIADLWAADMSLASVETVTTHHVESYDPLSVGLVFTTIAHLQHNRPSYFRTHLVRGCPYITVEYYGARPTLTAPNLITVVNGLELKDDPAFEPPALTGRVFDITVISGQQWLLFADPPITLRWTRDGRMVALEPYTGFLRIAVAPTPDVKAVLVAHWRVYPVGGDVALDYEQGSMVTYQWRRKGEGQLLMLALPHHAEILQDASTVQNATGVFKTLKGPMTAVLGDRWFLKETMPDAAGFHAPRPVPADKVEAIQEAVRIDLAAIDKKEHKRWNATDKDDPYWEGKRMAMYARLALIADEVGLKAESKKATKLAESVLLPWLTGENKNPLLYDTTWGGLVVQNGLSNPYANFGQTYYNDHHFQFGYFAYAAAVIAKLDAGFLATHGPKLRAIVQDIANDDDANPAFPLARHKDFFDGHSWASGLFSQNNGKSQESSSEAINAYYGSHLFGRATGDRKLERFAKLLLAMEIRSTKAYWHMLNATTTYDPDFAANKMVGVVGGLDATCHTWFGEKFEFVHGINMMPFTPVTEAYLDAAFVKEEYPVLATVLDRPEDPVEEEWKGFVHLDHAILDPEAAWNEVLQLKVYDSGNSLSNSLYWIATRPKADFKPATLPKDTTAAASSSSSSSGSKKEAPAPTPSGESKQEAVAAAGGP